MSDFSLLLFSVEPELIREAVAGGVSGVIVDWEYIGKERRQAGADTEINRQTLQDLRTVRDCTEARVICRINAVHEGTAGEIERALDAGADELLVPMVRTPAEVGRVLDFVRGRAEVSILIETALAAATAARFAGLPLSRVYVGLHDLFIERGTDHLFRAVADGTLEAIVRELVAPFGFGGLTVPDAGRPVPCRLLMGEMARLGCSFSMLRRSFHRDTTLETARAEVQRILAAMAQARARRPEETARDHVELLRVIERLPAVSSWRPVAPT